MTRIIIDTDPGQDDAVALLLALASPELDVAAITVVAGNVPLSRTTRNALVVRELAGRPDVPIHVGAAGPLVRPLVTAEHVHGHTGLDGVELPDPDGQTTQPSAAEAIRHIVMSSPSGSVTLCTLGPLTNVAAAFQQEPALAERLERIVMMAGGFFEGGNVTPAAEFNVFVDPEAAEIVFGSGVPIVMMPLDVTHQVLASRARVDRFRRMSNRAGPVVAAWLDFFDRHDRAKYGTDGAPLHDPCVIAYLLAADLFDGQPCNVEIETMSSLTLGMTVVDWWHVTDRPANATVMAHVDAERFFDLLVERIARLP